MTHITVAPSHDHFIRNNKAFFYLADTAWSAFTNIPQSEWEEYLDYRQAQGFNALQINILPQWDRTPTEFSPQPFRVGKNGRWDFAYPESAYFEKAVRMLEAAQQRGMTPALVVLWCDFVRGTWACAKMPDHEMPLEAIAPYVELVGRTFKDLDPIFLVSGDTDFKSPDTTARYLLALRTIKRICPSALTTLHLNPLADLPQEIVALPELDFYMFQSGHDAPQDLPVKLSTKFAGLVPKRPMVNGEPCYEGHGFGNTYGRFGAFHVRKAIWQSLLSGAKAGVTYGAHGVWSWHHRGSPFGSTAFSSTPYPWPVALRLPGAWDAGYAKWVFETFDLFDLEPVAEGLNGQDGIRLAMSPGREKIAAYIPYAADIRFELDLSGYESFLINLADRAIVKPVFRPSTQGGTVLCLPDFNSDSLFLAFRC